MKWYDLLAVFFCIVLIGCKKEEASSPDQKETNILSYSIQNFPATVSIEASEHSINIRFPDSVRKADDLVANFFLSPGCKATVKNIKQVSGVSKNNYAKTFFYTVSLQGNSADWEVTSTNNDYTDSLGLGHFLQQTASNDCSYPWYMDQAYTGPFSYYNCGPTCVTMACKWSDSAFAKTPEDARNAYRPEGGDWYPDDITFYLRDSHVPNSTLALPATAEGMMQTLKRQVDLHQIAILLLDMHYVRFANNVRSHADNFYATNDTTGHFIIIKGYKQVDDEMFFEVYDPGSMTKTYEDGSLVGKDRYYRSEDLFEATKNYWPKAFIVAKKGAMIIE